MSCSGFLPQPTRLTRCRRCFREYVDHRSFLNGSRQSLRKVSSSSSSSSEESDHEEEESVYANVQVTTRRRRPERSRSEPGASSEEAPQLTIRRSRFLHIDGVKDTSNRQPRVRPRSYAGDGAPPVPARDEPQAQPPPLPPNKSPAVSSPASRRKDDSKTEEITATGKKAVTTCKENDVSTNKSPSPLSGRSQTKQSPKNRSESPVEPSPTLRTKSPLEKKESSLTSKLGSKPDPAPDDDNYSKDSPKPSSRLAKTKPTSVIEEKQSLLSARDRLKDSRKSISESKEIDSSTKSDSGKPKADTTAKIDDKVAKKSGTLTTQLSDEKPKPVSRWGISRKDSVDEESAKNSSSLDKSKKEDSSSKKDQDKSSKLDDSKFKLASKFGPTVKEVKSIEQRKASLTVSEKPDIPEKQGIKSISKSISNLKDEKTNPLQKIKEQETPKKYDEKKADTKDDQKSSLAKNKEEQPNLKSTSSIFRNSEKNSEDKLKSDDKSLLKDSVKPKTELGRKLSESGKSETNEVPKWRQNLKMKQEEEEEAKKQEDKAKLGLGRKPSVKDSLTDIRSKFDPKPTELKPKESIQQDKGNANTSTGKMIGGVKPVDKAGDIKPTVEKIEEPPVTVVTLKLSPKVTHKSEDTAVNDKSPKVTKATGNDSQKASEELKSLRVQKDAEIEKLTKESKASQIRISELIKVIDGLKKDLSKSDETRKKLEKEKSAAISERAEKDKEALEKSASELLKLRSRVHQLESERSELKTQHDEANILRAKLQEAESLCADLTEENDEIKREVKNLESEMEELHDHFREDQASEFRDLKRELDVAAKGCRVMQFKLRKAERREEQLENEKIQLEAQLHEIRATAAIRVDQTRMRDLEAELAVAKELCARVSSELESTKEFAHMLEAEKESLRKQMHGGKSSPLLEAPSMLSGAKDHEELMRDLYDTMERENDLREQLKFAEDESKVARRKLSSLEQENETLMLQMKKMTQVNRARPNDSDSDEDEMTVDDLKLQLDMSEQEMIVLRRKIEELEQSNENSESEIKYLQNKLINQPITTFDLPTDLPPLDPSNPNVYYEHKLKLLEYEAKELRKKLVDKEKENERLQSEVEVHRRKASKVIVRSRSLDSELQVDLKRQLHLVEQEASILRQKVTDLENENDKIASENKRFQLRLSRKPPPGPADLLQLENMEMKLRNEELNRKIEAMRTQLEKEPTSSPATVIQEYKPKRESMTDAESELISALKKRLKEKDDENLSLQTKISQLEIESSRLNREFKKLKEALSIKKRPPKTVRDSATRMELREIVSDLQDEICELQVTLRGREFAQETMEEEAASLRRELEAAKGEVRARETDLERLKAQCESVRQESIAERERTETARRHLERAASEKGTSVDLISRVDTLTAQREKLEVRLKETESTLAREHLRVQQLTEQLASASSLRDELAAANKTLESQRQDLSKELDHRKKDLRHTEDQMKSLKSKLEDTEKELALYKAECIQLRSELEQEKRKVQGDAKSTASWIKEREELKRQVLDLKGRGDTMQIQMDYNEKEHKEKETKLREEYERKMEAVMSQRNKLESEMEQVRSHERDARNKLSQVTENFEKLEETVRELQEKQRNAASQLRRERDEWTSREADLEGRARTEARKRERAEREADQTLRSRESELLEARDRVLALEREARRLQTTAEEAQEEASRSRELAQSRADRDELASRYDQLESDFLALKTRHVSQREDTDARATKLAQELADAVDKSTKLKEKLTVRQESWDKEREEFHNAMRDLETKAEKVRGLEQERKRLQTALGEKDSLLDSYKREERHLKEEREKLRKRMEELARKVGDLERAGLRVRAEHAETSRQAELAALMAEYEGRLGLATTEIGSMQDQIAALVRERDELKQAKLSRSTGVEDPGTLKQQLDETREVLEDSQMENRNLRLQYDTDRAAWNLAMCELRTQVDRLEEQRALGEARQSRGVARARLELAWDKERSEAQRAISEANGLIVSLRDRLKDAEAERYRLKKSVKSSSQQDLHQMSELKHDLLSTREGQERLRNQLEGVRKDRDRLVLERQSWRVRLKSSQDLSVKVADVLDEVHKLASALQVHADRMGQKDIESILDRVKTNTEHLKKLATPAKDNGGFFSPFRRAISSSDIDRQPTVQTGDPSSRWQTPQRVTNYPLPPPSMLVRAPPRTKTLQRKSLSLDQSMARPDLMKIWDSGTESNVTSPTGSQLSLAARSDDSAATAPPVRGDRYRDLESEEEGPMLPSRPSALDKPPSKKGTLKDKFKMFRKSKSIDTGGSSWDGNNMSREEKEKTLRSKISKVLKKPLSKGSSVDEPKSHGEGRTTPTSGSRKSLLGRLNPERWGKSSKDSSKKPET